MSTRIDRLDGIATIAYAEHAQRLCNSGAVAKIISVGERLNRLKLPKRWTVLDALPRTPYGKVEKHKLRGNGGDVG